MSQDTTQTFLTDTHLNNNGFRLNVFLKLSLTDIMLKAISYTRSKKIFLGNFSYIKRVHESKVL